MTRKIQDAEVVCPDMQTGKTSEPSEPMDSAGTRTVVGCLRGTIAACASFLCALLGGIGVGLQSGIGMGILVGLALFIVLLGVAVYLMNNAKRLTVLDCILPIPIGAIAAVLFAPISLFAGSVFSAVTCLGASLLLSIMLFLYRAKKIHGGFLVIPFLVFVYEILPIELPTDIDNFLSLGGDGVNFVTSLLFMNNDTQLLE